MEPIVQVAGLVFAAAAVLVSLAALVLVGREQLDSTLGSFRARVVAVAPYTIVLGAFLALNSWMRPIVSDISWVIGFNATPHIYNLEGGFVAWLQALTPTSLLVYFSSVYVVGYVFLLVFPVVGYFCLPTSHRLKQLLVAYGLNYSIGLVLYALVVAYGPRNVMPDVVNQPLYELFPLSKLLTTAVNTNTNVFPSLHTSLSVTVLLFAWLTRDQYPKWVPIAAVLATSVVLSTMVLGIHWLIDVIAGIALAVVSVHLSEPIVRAFERRSFRRSKSSPTASDWSG